MNVGVMDVQKLARELLSLPLPSRAFLAEKLVESVDNYAAREIEVAWREEITRRVREYEEGEVHGIPSEQVFSDARKRLDETRQIPS